MTTERAQMIANQAHQTAAVLVARLTQIEFPIATAELAAHLDGFSSPAEADLYIERMVGHFANHACGTSGV